MRKNNKTKIIGLFTLVLTILTLSSCITVGRATTDDLIPEINQFKEEIKDIPKDCWRWPSIIRKWVIYIELSGIKRLILKEKFEDAYDKFLHSIKPKLTGLKTDENEAPWGNGVFKRPWIVCEEVREELRVKCNLILALIKSEFEPPIIDETPPVITIEYVGEGNMDDPGVWNVLIEDDQSGIDAVNISVNGVIIYQYELLGGIPSMSFNDISVPTVEDTHEIVVVAKDCDQNTIETSHSIKILPEPNPEPPPIIIS